MGALRLSVRWTRRALRQFDEALAFIEGRAPHGVAVVKAKVVRALERLEHLPDIGRPGRVAGTREFVVRGTPFVVAYRVIRNQVEILAFLHSSRRWPDAFDAEPGPI